MKTLKKLVLTAAMVVPFTASAGHMDVIESEFVNDCGMEEYMPIVADFNKWGEAYGYKAEIALPLQSNNLTHYFWIGTSANAAAFGGAWDAWRDGLSDPKSAPAKLQARFDECSVNLSRRSYDLF